MYPKGPVPKQKGTYGSDDCNEHQIIAAVGTALCSPTG